MINILKMNKIGIGWHWWEIDIKVTLNRYRKSCRTCSLSSVLQTSDDHLVWNYSYTCEVELLFQWRWLIRKLRPPFRSFITSHIDIIRYWDCYCALSDFVNTCSRVRTGPWIPWKCLAFGNLFFKALRVLEFVWVLEKPWKWKSIP